MGQNKVYFEIDYMLKTIFLVYYLLFIFELSSIRYLLVLNLKIDVNGRINLLTSYTSIYDNSKNNNNTDIINIRLLGENPIKHKKYCTNIQSAENLNKFISFGHRPKDKILYKGFSETTRQLSNSSLIHNTNNNDQFIN